MSLTDFRSNRSLSPYESSKAFGRDLRDIFLAARNISHATHKNHGTVDPHDSRFKAKNCCTYFDISLSTF